MAADRFEVGDRVRLKENPSGDGTVSRVGWDGENGQQLMVEVKWNTGWFSGPFVRDLVRISEEPATAEGVQAVP